MTDATAQPNVSSAAAPPSGRIEILGSSADALSMSDTLDLIQRRIDEGRFTQHVVINAAKVVNMQRDQGLAKAVNSCDIINIDGMSVVWAARLLGHDIPERVAGVDLFHALLDRAERLGWRPFFLGARQEVLDIAIAKIRAQHPKLDIAGHHHGYFWDDEEAVVRLIESSSADLLFVAITSPKKEKFIDKWRDRLGVKFAMGVGGTFDVVAGKTKRAPESLQRVGLEWLYRLAQEPRRLGPRYLDTNTRFIGMLASEMFRRKLKGTPRDA